MGRELTVENKYMKFQLAKPMSYHLTPTRRAKIKKLKHQLSSIANGFVKQCTHFGNLLDSC